MDNLNSTEELKLKIALDELNKNFIRSLCSTRINLQYWHFEPMIDRQFMKKEYEKCIKYETNLYNKRKNKTND
jgi:hypothetical protein